MEEDQDEDFEACFERMRKLIPIIIHTVETREKNQAIAVAAMMAALIEMTILEDNDYVNSMSDAMMKSHKITRIKRGLE